MSLPVIAKALCQLRAEGYEALSLSGGEPLLYPQIAALIETARDLEFRISLVTNGARVRPSLDSVLERLDRVAVSFDGLEAVHNRIRGHPRAFRHAIEGLDHLHALGTSTFMAYTVSRSSLREIPDAVELALSHGVSGLQLRPLIMAGRAATDCADEALNEAALNRLYLIGLVLEEEVGNLLAVHTDLIHTSEIAASRDAYQSALDGDAEALPLADLVNPLVILSDGTLKPFTYDFDARFDLGNVVDLDADTLTGMKRTRFPPFRGLLRGVFDSAGDDDRFVDWFFHCREKSAARRL